MAGAPAGAPAQGVRSRDSKAWAVSQSHDVVLTSSEERADVERAYDLGANSYLVKPGRTPELQALVARIDNYWLELNIGSSVGRST